MLVRRGRDEAVADPRRQPHRFVSESGDEDRRRLVRQVVEPRVLDRVVTAVMAALAAVPEHADDLHGLLEHLSAHARLGPAVAEDVLVQRLAGPDAELEAAGE